VSPPSPTIEAKGDHFVADKRKDQFVHIFRVAG
jgi:hypothetical protein